MENEFNFRPPPMPQNPLRNLEKALEQQAELMRELTGWAKETNALVLALRAGLNALVASHDKPDVLLSNFQDQMNRIADAVQPHRIELYRESVQQLQNLILERVNEPSKPQP